MEPSQRRQIVCRRAVENIKVGCIILGGSNLGRLNTIIFSFVLHFDSEKRAGFAPFFLKLVKKKKKERERLKTLQPKEYSQKKLQRL